MSGPFKPLDMQRVIREDPDITSSSLLALLICATLRMDDKTGRVRATEKMLAKDARVSPDTVQRAFGLKGEHVARYFRVTGGRKSLTFWFRPVEEIEAARRGEVKPHGAALVKPHGADVKPHGADVKPHGAASISSALTSALSSAGGSAPGSVAAVLAEHGMTDKAEVEDFFRWCEWWTESAIFNRAAWLRAVVRKGDLPALVEGSASDRRQKAGGRQQEREQEFWRRQQEQQRREEQG